MLNRTLAAIAAILLAGMTTAAQADDAVTVRLKWFNQAQFAGYYVAQDKGYYKAAGLDVNIQPGGPDFPAVQMVAGGVEPSSGVAEARWRHEDVIDERVGLE